MNKTVLMVLCAMYEDCPSIKCHEPEGRLLRHVRRELRGEAKRAIKQLVRKGYLISPGGKKDAYDWASKEALQLAENICPQIWEEL